MSGTIGINQGSALGVAADTIGGTYYGIGKIDISPAGAAGTLFNGTVGVSVLPNIPGGTLNTVGSVLGIRDKVFINSIDNGTISTLPNIPGGTLNNLASGTINSATVTGNLGTLGTIGLATVAGNVGVSTGTINVSTISTLPNIPGGTINLATVAGNLGTLGTIGLATITGNLGTLGTIGLATVTGNIGVSSGTINVSTISALPNTPGGTLNLATVTGNLGTLGTVGLATVTGNVGVSSGTINVSTISTLPNTPGGTINLATIAGNLGTIGTIGLATTTMTVGTVYKGVAAGVNGSFTAAGSVVQVGSQLDIATFDLQGTWVGTVFFEAQIGTSSWFGVSAFSNAGVVGTQTTGNGDYFVSAAGLDGVRARLTYASGTLTYNSRTSSFFYPGHYNLGGTISNIGMLNAGTISTLPNTPGGTINLATVTGNVGVSSGTINAATISQLDAGGTMQNGVNPTSVRVGGLNYLFTGGAWDRWFAINGAGADAQTFGIATMAPYIFNNSNWDRQYNNYSQSWLGTALRTIGTTTQGDQTNFNARGIKAVFPVTAFNLGTTTFEIDGKAPTSGAYYPLISKQVTAIGTYVLEVYPGITNVAGQGTSDVLPRTFRMVASQTNGSITYSADFDLLL